MTSLQSFVMGDVLFLTGVTLFFLIAYWVGRADILRRIWKRVRGRARVKHTFTLEFKKRVSEGEAYPRGYGFAFYDWETCTKIACPVPFNVIVRATRRVYFWYLEWFVTMRRGHSPLDRMLLRAHQRGRREGYDKGREKGYNEGHNDGFAGGRTILLYDLTKEVGRILAKGVDPQPEMIVATLVNTMRDKANDDNPPA